MDNNQKTFREYVKEKMEGRLTAIFSIDEIMEEWNMGLADTLYSFGILTNYTLRKHPDYDWTLVVFDHVQAKAIKDKQRGL